MNEKGQFIVQSALGMTEKSSDHLYSAVHGKYIKIIQQQKSLTRDNYGEYRYTHEMNIHDASPYGRNSTTCIADHASRHLSFPIHNKLELPPTCHTMVDDLRTTSGHYY